jgi:hypothetical protein
MRARSERSVPEVVQDIIRNLREILRSEFQLATTEIKEEAAEAVTPIAAMGFGAVLGVYALGLLLLSAVYALALVIAIWSAALLVGAAVAMIALLLINWGRNGLKRINVKSETLIASLQENLRWANKQN